MKVLAADMKVLAAANFWQKKVEVLIKSQLLFFYQNAMFTQLLLGHHPYCYGVHLQRLKTCLWHGALFQKRAYCDN
jgi:hypothetical protein